MSEQAVAFDSATYHQTIYLQTMGNFATAVVVVTGLVDAQPIGFAAQSFVSLIARPAAGCFQPGQVVVQLVENSR